MRTKKKALNWIRHVCNSLLKCQNDDEAIKYKDTWLKLANNNPLKCKLYSNLVFINDSYDVNNGLEAITIYFKGEWTPYNITLQRLKEVFIPLILKGLRKKKWE